MSLLFCKSNSLSGKIITRPIIQYIVFYDNQERTNYHTFENTENNSYSSKITMRPITQYIVFYANQESTIYNTL